VIEEGQTPMNLPESWSRAMRALIISTLVLAAFGPAWASEPEPTLPSSSLLPSGTPTRGPGWVLRSPTSVQAFLGQFRFDTDWGPIEASGRELALLRIGEMPALAQLDQVTRGKVFADAIRASAVKSGQAVVRVVTDPVGTVKGIPAGLGRLVSSTARSVRRTARAIGDAASRDSDTEEREKSDSDNSEKLTNFAKESVGLNKSRRALARQIGVDPYTRNPLLQQKLESLAWAAVAGGISMDLALGALSGGASSVLSISTKLDDLVWDLPPDDIQARVEQALVKRGHLARDVRKFLRNGVYTPTLQLRLLAAFESLGRPRGEPAALALAATVNGEVHARFLIAQIEMMAKHGGADPVAELLALEQSFSSRTRSGATLVTLPVDYLAWTGPVDRTNRRGGRIVVSGLVSPLALRELSARGWRVQSNAGAPG
jgi:hypothetical protein